jgi:hypothetical protein
MGTSLYLTFRKLDAERAVQKPDLTLQFLDDRDCGVKKQTPRLPWRYTCVCMKRRKLEPISKKELRAAGKERSREKAESRQRRDEP